MKKIKKINLKSLSIKEEQKEKLKQFFPEVFNEEEIDFEKLKLSLGGDIDNGRERYGMNWPGKLQAIKVAQLPSNATLKPDEKASVDFDKTQNLFIEGDNLEVLKLLQKSYFGKIKMCYLDPPYNTGKEFIYPDKYEEGIQTYLQYTGQIDAEGKKFSTNVETDGRFHSKWMNMMWPRLYLARNLLKDDGAIFISINDNEITNLRKICDEIFGEENFIDQFIIRSNPRGNQAKKYTASVHEYVICYFKDKKSCSALGAAIEEEVFDKTDEYGKVYREIGLRKRGAGSKREEAPNQYFPIYYNPKNKKITTKNEGKDFIKILPKLSNGQDGRWRWADDTVGENIDSLIVRLVRRNGEEEYDIFEKDYYSDDKISKIKSIFYEKEVNYENATEELKLLFGGIKIFDYPKPTHLIKKFVENINSKDAIILDLFVGSGTTAHAVMDLNAQDGGSRRFIVTQLPEKTGEETEAYKAGYKNITGIGEERIRKAGKKIMEENKGKEGFDAEKFDKGFKVFKLDKSNFTVWDGATGGNIQKKLELHVNNTDPKSKEEDILYEILIKAGFELTEKVDEIKIEGKKVYSISTGQLFICLDEKIDKNFVRSLVEKKPKQIICLNSSFKEDADLTNTAKILENSQIEFRTI